MQQQGTQATKGLQHMVRPGRSDQVPPLVCCTELLSAEECDATSDATDYAAGFKKEFH